MNFIDVFNFSKYFKRNGDGHRAKIGHVNSIIESFQTDVTDIIQNYNNLDSERWELISVPSEFNHMLGPFKIIRPVN